MLRSAGIVKQSKSRGDMWCGDVGGGLRRWEGCCGLDWAMLDVSNHQTQKLLKLHIRIKKDPTSLTV